MPIIDEKLIEQYKELHEASGGYGDSACFLMYEILACLVDLKPNSVLEYGCGRSDLIEILPLENVEFWVRYDPALLEFVKPPYSDFDLVINTDMMEHIPACDIDIVLEDIRCYSENVFFNISTRAAECFLPNGDNAHCTVWGTEVWLAKIKVIFPEAHCVYRDDGESCVIITWPSRVGSLISHLRKCTKREREWNELSDLQG